MLRKSSVPIKFPIHLWSTYVHSACVLLQLRILQCLLLKRIWGNSTNCFRKEKSPYCSAMLVINLSIKLIHLESSCFYFPKNDSENDWFRLNDMLEIKLFLKSDQIKSRPMFFSLQFYNQVVAVLHYVSQKSKSFPFFIIGFLPEMITIRFAGWISGRIVSLQPDKDIQNLLWNGNQIRIRISETLLLIFRGFRLLEKVAHCTIIHFLSSFRSIFSAICAMTPSLSMVYSLYHSVITLPSWTRQICWHESVPGVSR